MSPHDFAEGPYRRHLELFVEYKRGKGEKCGGNLMRACKKISESLASEEDAAGLGEATVRLALRRLDGEGDWPWSRRVSVMRQFCAFLNAFGVPCWNVPPRFCPSPHSEFRPYILTDADIGGLLRAADSAVPPGPRPGCELICPVLVRLLVSTGVRVSEALALDMDDYASDAGVLAVVNSKNGVSRNVPLSGSMASWLDRYLRAVERDSGPMFTSPYTGIAWRHGGVYSMFEKLYDAAAIRNESGRRPRIHDLRHTFCTRSLDKMLTSGMSVYEAVPILAAYVGHANYADTEKYIHLTNADRSSFVAAERALASLIPKAVV